MALLVVVSPATQTKNQDLLVAIEEMITANHFTFVMLINMSPIDQRLEGNITFLMPNDRMLSRTRIPQQHLSDFLLRHSIPSPLLFDYLQHIPTGSFIPSSIPEYMLKISNGGRLSYFLNNVKIISPNICTRGSSIRCHGIDGVLMLPEKILPKFPPLPTCSNNTVPVLLAPPPTHTPIGDSNHNIPAIPPPPPPQRSPSFKCRPYGAILNSFYMLPIVGLFI
ncbi:hypothetical protein HS088_TW04G01072 [Tripterygium wilfordii]|uniref:FAS1 domain-containing protein n=2 Tax=Tripterygium wilfordii TaxID=458696 RepID=A0A7J7DRW6_TRIWF|nr:hypothetical protein HS088_TW04G01072 [Tripterygium wilfordii]